MMHERTYAEKPANSWHVSDIEELVGQEEGTYLEFKKPSESVKKRVFSRDDLSPNWRRPSLPSSIPTGV